MVHDHLHIAGLLIDYGAHIHARDNSGKAAYDYAKNPEGFKAYAKNRKLLRPFTFFYCKLYEEGEVPLDIIRTILGEFLRLAKA